MFIPLVPTQGVLDTNFKRTAHRFSFKIHSNYQKHKKVATLHPYGFQGQETDHEIKGEGNSVNYKYRMHDARIGRFFAVDPFAKVYAYNSPYAFSENRVIDAIELEGLEKYYTKDLVFLGQVGDDGHSRIIDMDDVSNKLLESNNGLLETMIQLAVADEGTMFQVEGYNNTDELISQFLFDNSRITNGTENWEILKSSIDVSKFSLAKQPVDLSPQVKFTSQWTLVRPKVACNRASRKILKDSGLDGSSGSKAGRIITAKNNSSKTALKVLPEAKNGVAYIDAQLEAGNPVMVGVNHTMSKTQSDGEAADHYVVIVGRSRDDAGNIRYQFYEVGTKHKAKGTSKNNYLSLNKDNSLSGKNYNNKNYTVTEVRKNVKKKK